MKFILFLFITIYSTQAFSKEYPVTEITTSNMYTAKVFDGIRLGLFKYYADTEAELCFATYAAGGKSTSLEVVDCKSLAKRAGWGEVITWVEKE